MATSFTPTPILRGRVPMAAPSIGSPAYIVGAYTTVTIRSIDPTNTTPSTITWSVWVVPAAAVAIDDTMLVIATVPVYASNVGVEPDNRITILAAGDRIYWQASADGLNGYISAGVEVL